MEDLQVRFQSLPPKHENPNLTPIGSGFGFFQISFQKNIKKYQKGIKVPVIIRHFLLCLKQKRGDYYEIKKGESVIGSQKIC